MPGNDVTTPSVVGKLCVVRYADTDAVYVCAKKKKELYQRAQPLVSMISFAPAALWYFHLFVLSCLFIVPAFTCSRLMNMLVFPHSRGPMGLIPVPV